MEKIPPMISMRHTPDEKEEEAEEYSLPSPDSVPDYPYGLSISLGQDELEKLSRQVDDFELGDLIHMHVMGVVTSVSQRADQSGENCRVEIQITHISAENEEDENEEEEKQEDASSRLYKM